MLVFAAAVCNQPGTEMASASLPACRWYETILRDLKVVPLFDFVCETINANKHTDSRHIALLRNDYHVKIRHALHSTGTF